MRQALIFLAALSLSPSALAGGYRENLEFLNACSGEAQPALAMCEGYVGAVIDMAKTRRRRREPHAPICLPDGITVRQISEATVQFSMARRSAPPSVIAEMIEDTMRRYHGCGSDPDKR